MSNVTTLRMRVLPRYPARVSGANGLTVQRQGADLVVKPDFGSLAEIFTVESPNDTYFWTWRAGTDEYDRISFQKLVDGVGSIIIGPNLIGLASIASDADKVPYFIDNAGNASAFTMTSFVRGISGSADAAAYRASLGLGGAAILNVGTTAGTVAAGDDTRIVNAVQTSRTLTAGTGLTGGGDLSANRTIALNAASIASLVKADSALQPLTRIQTRSDIVRGDNISDPLWASRIGGFANGERGPLFVWNNPSPSDYVNGKNAAAQFWVGDNPTATPDVSAPVAVSVAMVGGNDRTSMYGLNIVVGNGPVGGDPTYKDGLLVGLEVNMYSGYTASVTDAFVGGNRKNGIEVYGQSGSAGRLTAAMMVGVNDTTGNVWWYEGLALSRIVNNGVRFTQNPGGATDAINAFQNAAILDESNSASVLKIGGTHGTVVDMSLNPTLTRFVRGFTDKNTSLLFTNGVNFSFALTIDSGTSAAQSSSITLADRGVAKYQLIKNNGNAFGVFDVALGRNPIVCDSNAANPVSLYIASAERRIEVGANDSGGAGFRMVRVVN